MFLVAIIEFLSAVWSAVLGCGVMCKCCKNIAARNTTVQYTDTPVYSPQAVENQSALTFEIRPSYLTYSVQEACK